MLAFYLLLSPLSVLLFAGVISFIQSSFSQEGVDND